MKTFSTLAKFYVSQLKGRMILKALIDFMNIYHKVLIFKFMLFKMLFSMCDVYKLCNRYSSIEQRSVS